MLGLCARFYIKPFVVASNLYTINTLYRPLLYLFLFFFVRALLSIMDQVGILLKTRHIVFALRRLRLILNASRTSGMLRYS